MAAVALAGGAAGAADRRRRRQPCARRRRPIARCRGARAGLVVLPELATSGYCFADADEARRPPSRSPARRPTAWARGGRRGRRRSWSAASASSTRTAACATPSSCSARRAAGPLPQAAPVGPRDRALRAGRRGAAGRRHAGRATRGRRLLRPLVPGARARAGPRRRRDRRLPEQLLALAGPGRAAAPRRGDGDRDGPRQPPAHRGRRPLRDGARTRWVGAALVVDADGVLLAPPPADDRPGIVSPPSTSPRRATSAGAPGTTCSPTGGPGCTGRATVVADRASA